MQSTLSSQILVYLHLTLLAYDPEHICLQHHTHIHNCTSIIVYMLSLHYWIYKSNKKMNCNFIYDALSIYVPATNILLKCHICQLLHVQIYDNYVSISTSYENAINSVTMTTGMHTFHNTGICP